MKKIIYILFLFLYSLFGPQFSYSQNPPKGTSKIDSLQSILKIVAPDSNKVNTLSALAETVRNSDPDTCIYFANQALILASKINYKAGETAANLWIGTALTNLGDYGEALKYMQKSKLLCEQIPSQKLLLARIYNNLGNIYWRQSNYPEALKNNYASLKIKQELGSKQGIADSYNNIGNINSDQGNYPEALKNHFAAAKLREQLGNKNSIADSYVNIGNTYYRQHNTPQALIYYLRSLKLKEEINDAKGIATAHSNLGNLYSDMDDFESALKSYTLALKFRETIGDKSGIAKCYNNIATIYMAKGDFNEALKNHFISLKMKEAIGDNAGIASSCNNIASIFIAQKKSAEAVKYLQKSLAISTMKGDKEDITLSYECLVQADSLQRNDKKMLEHFKLFILYRDSLFNEENTKKTVQAEMNFEFDKKEAAAKLEQEKKEAIAIAESRKQKIIIWSICGILLLVFAFAVFAYRSYLQKQKVNIEITAQKHLIEEKQKEILDSIYYARRIQQALLPNENYIKKNLNSLKS